MGKERWDKRFWRVRVGERMGEEEEEEAMMEQNYVARRNHT